MTEKIERFYTVPFGDVYNYTRTKRAKRSVKVLQKFLTRHMKTKNVSISEAINQAIWSRGIERPPRRIKIRAIREGEKTKAYLADEKIEKPAVTVEQKPKENVAEAKKTEEKK